VVPPPRRPRTLRLLTRERALRESIRRARTGADPNSPETAWGTQTMRELELGDAFAPTPQPARTAPLTRAPGNASAPRLATARRDGPLVPRKMAPQLIGSLMRAESTSPQLPREFTELRRSSSTFPSAGWREQPLAWADPQTWPHLGAAATSPPSCGTERPFTGRSHPASLQRSVVDLTDPTEVRPLANRRVAWLLWKPIAAQGCVPISPPNSANSRFIR
jgi:hypothetical protein